MLLNVSGKLGDDDVASTLQSAVLDEKVAAADSGYHAVRKRERLSGGRCVIEHLRDRNHALVRDRGAVHPRPQLHTSLFVRSLPGQFRGCRRFCFLRVDGSHWRDEAEPKVFRRQLYEGLRRDPKKVFSLPPRMSQSHSPASHNEPWGATF